VSVQLKEKRLILLPGSQQASESSVVLHCHA
jgi:hypothetical protein